MKGKSLAEQKTQSVQRRKKKGKLIQHIPSDDQMINDSSIQLFNLIHDICRQMNLSKMVPVLSRANIYEKKQKIATEKVMPGIASTIISKQLDDVAKHAKSIHQRIQISLNSICRVQRSQQKSHRWKILVKKMIKALTRLLKQNHLFIKSLDKTVLLCKDLTDDRNNHIKAIETARNRIIFDHMNEYQNVVLETQGREEYKNYIHNVKRKIFENNYENVMEINQKKKLPKFVTLSEILPNWKELILQISLGKVDEITEFKIKKWYKQVKKSRQCLKSIMETIKLVRQEE